MPTPVADDAAWREHRRRFSARAQPGSLLVRGSFPVSARRSSAEDLLATRAAPCPTCGTRPSELDWLHVPCDVAGGVPADGWSGWLSLCHACGRSVDAFEDAEPL